MAAAENSFACDDGVTYLTFTFDAAG